MQNNLSLKFECLDIYNLALYNNSIPLLDELTIINGTDYNLKNIEVEISSTPSFFSPFITKIGNISSGRHITITPHDLDIDLTKVMYSTAPITSLISVKAKSLGEIVSETSKSVTLYPYDFIPSLDSYTELIASFVTPNQEEIKSVVEKVFEHLKKDFSLPINQDMWDYKNKSLINCIIQSIYYAICDLKITFNAYVSNDNKPTKIKLPETILSHQNGTSLEIALLTASVAERLGINPFITFITDKVLVGFFYGANTFKTCITDDISPFTNLVCGKCDSFVIVDTTSMMYGTNVTFDNSALTAQKSLEQSDSPITVDIARCRRNGYRSMPVRTRQNGNIIFEVNTAETTKATETFSFLKSPDTVANYVEDRLLGASASEHTRSIKNDKSIFLIGTTKHIVSKFLFNNTLTLKYFPLSNQTNNTFDFFEKISQLNSNIDTKDFSHIINSFNDKKEIFEKSAKLLKECDESAKNLCATFGAVKYVSNGKVNVTPIFYININLKVNADSTIDISPLTSELKPTHSILKFLHNNSINFDFSLYSDNYLENYETMIKELELAANAITSLEVFDIATITALSIDTLSMAATIKPEYFEKSAILNQVFKKGSVESLPIENVQLDIPVPLDSTQEKALNKAFSSQCTVFSGPDGSGKTTTCATVAFNSIKKGDKVLYLSSSKTNIDTFCSFANDNGFDNYTFKSTGNVFSNFNTPKSSKEASENPDVKERLVSSVEKESSYYKNLHSVKEIGFSLYEAISQYERYRSFPYSVAFTNEQIEKLSRNDVVLWFDTVSQLSKAGAECKEPHSNPLYYVKESNFSYDLKSKAAISLNRHLAITQNFIDAQNALSEFLGIEAPIMKEKHTQTLLELSDCVLKSGEYIYNGIFLKKDIDSCFSKIEVILSQCDNYFELKNFLTQSFKNDVILLDCNSLLTEWRNANSKFAFTKQSALTQVKNKLKSYCIDSKLVTNDNFTDLVTKISSYISSTSLLHENSELILSVTGIDINTILESTDSGNFDSIKQYISTSKKYLKTLMDIYDAEQQPSTVFSHNYNLFRNPAKLKTDISHLYAEFSSAYTSYVASENEVIDILKIDIESAKEQNNKIWYYFVAQFFDKMLNSIDLLKYWCSWNVEKAKAISVGLENVVVLYETEQLSSGDIKNAFLKGFFKSVSEYFLSNDNIISSFSSEKHNEELKEINHLISKNKENLIVDLQDAMTQRIESYLQKNNLTSEEATTMLGRNLSTVSHDRIDRNTLALLQETKPCFVCDSVKSILKFGEFIDFDLIIVDSDTKQSPYELLLLLPLAKRIVYTETQNTFFGEFLRHIGGATVSFDWIYTSNKTMPFINELFYDNSLSLIPPMNHNSSKINVIYQLGNYDRKKTRVNVIEASAVVDEVMKVVGDSSDKTVGVYAMTEEQQQLIDFLLQKRSGGEYRKNITVSSFAKAVYSPKDYIIFSTVFSKEERSKYKESITRTIPELSSDNSLSRMINVLSSATGEFTIVTSLSEDTLNNFRTTEKNYFIFKKLLKKIFSAGATRTQKINTCDTTENSIIRQVATFVESLGYKADLAVGYNKSIIDIAVKNKGSDNYLLGIMFDETAYINSDNFFGRNLIFKNLKSVGNWKIITIHTVEWFENPNKQLDLISSLLDHDNRENLFPIYN